MGIQCESTSTIHRLQIGNKFGIPMKLVTLIKLSLKKHAAKSAQ
jgi:hypothetical protein